MGKTNPESGHYWVDKSLACNGCKFLNFYKRGCRRDNPPGVVRPLSTYLNGDGYVAVLRPPDCDYTKGQSDVFQSKAAAS